MSGHIRFVLQLCLLEVNETALPDYPADGTVGINMGRKRKPDPQTWQRNVRHRSRCTGSKYVTRKGKPIQEKRPLVDKCAKCRFNCRANFSEERRLLLCREYYGLANAARQKTFIVSVVVEKDVGRQRSRKHVDARKKGKSCEYYLVGNSQKKLVCQSFFCRTFAISNCVVYAALKGKENQTGWTNQ